MKKISKYNEGGEEGETARYEQGEHEEKTAKKKKVGISGGGHKETGKTRQHRTPERRDNMAHSSHHKMNKLHGTGNGFVTGEEYQGNVKASKGAASLDSNTASCD